MTCILSTVFDEHWDVSMVGKSLSLLRLIRCWFLRASLFMSVEFASNIFELSLSTDVIVMQMCGTCLSSILGVSTLQKEGPFKWVNWLPGVKQQGIYILKMFTYIIWYIWCIYYRLYTGYTDESLVLMRHRKKTLEVLSPFSGQQWSSICCGSFWASPWSQLRNAPP